MELPKVIKMLLEMHDAFVQDYKKKKDCGIAVMVAAVLAVAIVLVI